MHHCGFVVDSYWGEKGIKKLRRGGKVSDKAFGDYYVSLSAAFVNVIKMESAFKNPLVV